MSTSAERKPAGQTVRSVSAQHTYRWRRDPRLRKQVGAQQLRQGRGIDLVVLQPRRGDRLALQRMHHVRLEAVGLQQLQQPPQPNAASYAAGVPAGSFPITDKIGLTPLGTLRLARTSPPSLITATWNACGGRRFRRRQTSRASFPSSYIIPET
jgi:hypothetical protein